MPVTVRPATEADAPALAQVDSSYETGRYLHLARSGEPPELTFAFEWRDRQPGRTRAYPQYDAGWYLRALSSAGLFLAAEVDGAIAGYLIVVPPKWTDAAEITDLAVDVTHRRRGAGRALITSATSWARERRYRALWVEPRSDNAGAIELYSGLGFRLAGFNDRMYSNRDEEPGRATLYMYLELGSAATAPQAGVRY